MSDDGSVREISLAYEVPADGNWEPLEDAVIEAAADVLRNGCDVPAEQDHEDCPGTIWVASSGPLDLDDETPLIVRELRKLRAALMFYADPETYHAIDFWTDPPCGEFDDDFSEAHGHPNYDRAMPGKRARIALGWEQE